MSRGTNFGAAIGGKKGDVGPPAMRHTRHYERWELEAAIEERSLTRRERRALERLTKPRRGKP
jgi:hypothetical protein